MEWNPSLRTNQGNRDPWSMVSGKFLGFDVALIDPAGFHGVATHKLLVVADVAGRGVQILVEDVAVTGHTRIALLRELGVKLRAESRRTWISRQVLHEIRIVLQII